MDRRRAAGALLALAACIACATAAPTASNQTALDLYDTDSTEGCYYNFQHYGEGDRIMTNEPCLNCTCHNRMLMCYLRVCPFTKPIGQDCTVEKRADQCCPIVTCPDVPVDLLTSTPTTSPAEYGTTGVGRLDKYGCSINGKYFSEGSKVPPSPNKPCEHCYCIRNMTTCVMQECTLHVDGCTPIYHKEVCCPIRYSCDHQDDEVPMLDDMTTTVRPTPGFLLTTTTIASVTQIPQECVHEDQIFPDGALIKTEKACEHCYCMKGDIVCVVQECGTPMENEGKNCTSLAPREGQCCPDTYICEGDETPTEVPTEISTETATEIEKEAATQEPTEEAIEVQKETQTEAPSEETSEKQNELTTEVNKETSTEIAPERQTERPVSTEETSEVQKETQTEIPSEEPTEKQEETRTELPKDSITLTPTEVEKESVTQIPEEQATVMPIEEVTKAEEAVATESPFEKAGEVQTDATTEVQNEVTSEKSKETPTEVPRETVTELPKETATEVPHDEATEVLNEVHRDVTTEVPQYEATAIPTEVQKESVTQMPEEQATVLPIEEITKAEEAVATEVPEDLATKVPIEVQKEAATELPKDETTDVPTKTEEEAPTDAPIQEPTDVYKETVTEAPMEKTSEIHEPEIDEHKETTIEGSGESVGDKISEPTTQSANEVPIESTTRVAYEAATQAATEADTEEPTEVPTTFVPPRRTSVEGSGYRNEPDELFTESPFLEQETEGSGYEEDIKKPSAAEVTSVPIEETTLIIRDAEMEVTSATDISTHSPSTEQPTTEPDKGENTVPNDESTQTSIFDVGPSEASATTQEKEHEKQAVTTPETLLVTETATQAIATEQTSLVEDEKITKSPAEVTTRKEQEDMVTDKQDATEYPALTTEREEIDIQTTVFDEKESKSTTVQLPDTPAAAEAIKPEDTTTEAVLQYTSAENILEDQDLFTTAQPSIEESYTTPSKTVVPEITSINPLENEIHEEVTPVITPGVIPGEGNCLVEGITYNNDTAVPTTHKCQSSCRCMSSIVKCEEIMCAPPPENMGSCKSVYDSEETCCPYYTCDQAKETPPLKPHSQMSGTELPITQGDCQGELCNKQEEGTQISPVSPQCTSGDCASAIDNKERERCGAAGCEGEQVPVLVPSKEEVVQPEVCSDGKCISPPKDCAGDQCQLPTRNDCGKDGSCEVPSQDTCEGGNCDVAATPMQETSKPTQQDTQGCTNVEDCKPSSPDVITPTCEGGECTIIKQECSSGICESKPVEVPDMDVKKQDDCSNESGCEKPDQSEEPQTVCAEESCGNKEDTQDKPLPVCTDESCVQQVTSAPTSVTGLLSTELPEPADKRQTVLPETIATETESQLTSESVTEQAGMDATDLLVTQKPEASSENEMPTVAQESTSQESVEEETTTQYHDYITKAQDESTKTPESEVLQTKPSIPEDIESSATEKSQPALTTVVAELEEPQDVTHRQDIITDRPIDSTSLESTSVPSKEVEVSTEQQITTMSEIPVTERDEINAEIPERLPTESSKQPEETAVPEVYPSTEETAATKLPEQEPSMAQEPAVTEALLEPMVTESQLEFVTTGNKNVDVSQAQDEQDLEKTPKPATEVPEVVTEIMTEIPTVEKLATEPQEIGTTAIPVSDEQAMITETPKKPTIQSEEPATDVPHVSIIDEEDNTEVPQQEVSPDLKPESTESPTTAIYDAYTKEQEMPMSEEQIKHTVIPEVPVTESRDSDTTSIDQEQTSTTSLAYSVTTPRETTDSLREGVVIDKEPETPVTEAEEPEISAPVDEENVTQEPDVVSPDIDKTVAGDKFTTQSEPTSTEAQKATEITDQQNIVTDIPASPATEKDIIGTEVPELAVSEDFEKQTESSDTSVSDTVTKSPEISTEPDLSTDEPVSPIAEYPESGPVLPEKPGQEDQYPAHETTVKPEPEEPITEVQMTDENTSESVLPQEPEQKITIQESATTESQEIVTLGPADHLPEEIETPVHPLEDESKSTTKAPEDQYIEPDVTKDPHVDEQPTTAEIGTPQPVFEKETLVPEVVTNAPFVPVTIPQEVSTIPAKPDESEYSVTQAQEPVETITTIDERATEMPETSAKEPEDSFITTTLAEQELQTVRPEGPVTEKEDVIPQVSEIAQPEEVEQQNEIPESPITQSPEIATKMPDTQAETEVPAVTPQQEISSNKPEYPVAESQDTSTDSTGPSIPKEQEAYTNAPVFEITTAQDQDAPTSGIDKEITDAPATYVVETSTPDSTISEDVQKQPMIPDSNLTEPELTSTQAPRDTQTEAPASYATESQEVFTNVPVVLIPEEQPTESPILESQEPSTNVLEEKEEIQTEKPQEPSMPEEPVTEENVTDIPKKDIEEPEDITDAPAPSVTERQDTDIPVTGPQDFVTQTSQPKLEYSETTPYLVELEEHTHKIEIETSTISEDVSVPQTTEYVKPEEPLTETEITKQTEPAVTTEKIKVVASLEPITDVPTTVLEYAPTEAGSLDSKFGADIDTSSPTEQSTEKSDVDDSRRTTIASDEVEDKAPDTPVTDKETEATEQPSAVTQETVKPTSSEEVPSEEEAVPSIPGVEEKYTTTQTPEKSTQSSSEEVSSEEDSIPVKTTVKADEATTFTPIDKATVSEPKPTEPPSAVSQETVKPTSSEEVPSEEEAVPFPPSGTSGYGQEPDYVEEDQAFGPGTCRYGGKVYVSAQQIPRDDPCDFCFCFRSDIICLQQSCPPPIHGCHEEPIQGFCCPRYECPVSMATTLNVTTTTTTTTTTLPPHFLTHAYNGAAQKRGCLIKGHTYKVGEVVRASSGPCLHCTCGGDGQMKCDPKVCTPEPMLRQMIAAAAVSAKRRR